MSSPTNPNKLSVLLSVAIFLIIGLAGYFTIGDLAGKQSQQQQQSISPVFALIEKELLKPLQIATTLSDIGVYDEYFLSETPDEEALVAQLKQYHETFNLEFYLAHDKSRQQFNSDGRVFDLIKGKIFWYFTLKNETDSDVQAVLGKREDVHLYIDVRQYDDIGEFIGFVGVGKSLSDFLASFEQFRNEYGHEFVFVNNRNEIVLSSLTDLSPTQADSTQEDIGIKQISDVSWFGEFQEKAADNIEPSEIVEVDKGDLLVSKLSLKSLNWNLFILTPLGQRQQAVNKSFALYVGIGFLLFLIIYKTLYQLADKYINKVSRRINQDPLTKLANREYARQYFYRMRKSHRQVAVVLADLDNFKQVNDKFGHMAGDEVLTKVASVLQETLSLSGLVVRWGGEEFILILPDSCPESAKEIAETCRIKLTEIELSIKGQTIPISASFGICCSRQLSDTIDVMIERADRTMYVAKAEGKNRVLMHSNETLLAAS